MAAYPGGGAGYATYDTDSPGSTQYADQRYYSVGVGRFNTPDPYKPSGGVGDPSSWNRYSYVRSDPINRYDPLGLQDQEPGRPYDPLVACPYLGGMAVPQSSCPEPAPPPPMPTGTTNIDTHLAEWGMAVQTAYDAATALAKKQDWSKKCITTLIQTGVAGADIATAIGRVQHAASSVTFFDGTISAQPLRSLYANRPELARNVADRTIMREFELRPGTAAMAELGGNLVYIRPSIFNQIGSGYAMATVLHELLHNITGLTDPDLQRNLKLPEEGEGSRNITLRLLSDCLL